MKNAWMHGCLGGLTVLAGLVGGCREEPKTLQLDPRHAYVDAREALLASADDEDPRVRTKALEALAATDGAAAGPLMAQALRDGRAPVQFAAAMAIGDTRYLPAKPLLAELAKAPDVPPKLMLALTYALHRLGDDTYTRDLVGAKTLYHPDRWVRATAAMVLGKLGEPSAKGPLKLFQQDDHDPVVQLQVVEALARLGDERSMVLLEAFAKGDYLEDRIIAVQAMGYLDLSRTAYVLKQILVDRNQDPAVRVCAAGSLGRMKQPAGYEYVLMAALDPRLVMEKARGRGAEITGQELANLQVLAALALGELDNTLAVDTLHPLLRSRDGAVRVAAGKAILQLLAAYKPPPPPPPEEAPEASPSPAPAPPASRPGPELHSSGPKG